MRRRERKAPKLKLTYRQALDLIARESWHLAEHVTHTRGVRLNVVTRSGKPRTITIVEA